MYENTAMDASLLELIYIYFYILLQRKIDVKKKITLAHSIQIAPSFVFYFVLTVISNTMLHIRC